MSDLALHRPDHAPILYRSENEVCFQVDDVTPAATPSCLRAAESKLQEAVGRPLVAFSHESSSNVVHTQEIGEHGFVNAVHLAFSEHRPLVITPDAIWLTLEQGFVQHVNNHAEALRSRFVGHKGRVTLTVEVTKFPSNEEWPGVVEEWSAGISKHVEGDLCQRLICNFSTTTPITRTASQVAMMDAFQRYFEYELFCICGIPSITLKGTVADWAEIRRRVGVMAQYHLEWWTDHLESICDAFVETAKGAPSRPFWQHIYKPREVYGGDVITGWLGYLFPYVKDYQTDAPTMRNPYLNVPEASSYDLARLPDGLPPKRVPNGLSQAPFVVRFRNSKAELHYDLIAGFIGVAENRETGQVQPEIGWAVCEKVESNLKGGNPHARNG
ncbi:MAG TPA: DUF4419 domain-containing protein [Nitrospira sp.]|nr:DUF4419 domain-containing protein [Nitrospira sp.]